MATADEQWWDAQAGEYVLGTLRTAERDIFERILQSDTDVQQRVSFWQQHFSSLDQNITPVRPPDYIWKALLARIQSENPTSQAAPRASTTLDSFSDNASDLLDDSESGELFEDFGDLSEADNVVPIMERSQPASSSSTIWKAISGLSLAATIAMAAVLMQLIDKQAAPVDAPLDVVSVVQSEELNALWVLSAQENSTTLKVVALAPPPIEQDKSYQLWMVKADDSGVSSVGLLPTTAGTSSELSLPISTDQAQVFAVSLEPAGGSPEAGPTGPVLFTGNITTVDTSL